jgi:hypothetical protein
MREAVKEVLFLGGAKQFVDNPRGSRAMMHEMMAATPNITTTLSVLSRSIIYSEARSSPRSPSLCPSSEKRGIPSLIKEEIRGDCCKELAGT